MSREYSTTVTSVPNEAKTEANSSPMTPAPMTQSRAGISDSERISREVTTPGRPAPGIGSEAGSDPVATKMKSDTISVSPPSARATRTVWASTKRARP